MAAANAVSNLIVAANAMISQEALNWTEVVTTYDWHKVDEKKINPDNPELVAIEETRKEALAVVERTITSIGQVLSAASGYIADK